MDKCKYCGNRNILPFYKSTYPLYSLPLQKMKKNKILSEGGSSFLLITTLTYYYCENCGLTFSNISKKENEIINQIYGELYNFISPLASNIATSEIDSYIKNLNLFLSKIKSVLGIGCFDGYVLYQLQKRGIKVLGIDPSKAGVKIAKDHGIKVINDFFTSSMFNEEKFDAIISRHVIEHVEHPFDFFKEQIEILNKNGFISFETPNTDWFILKGNDEAFHSQHQILLTKKFIIKLLEDLDIKYAYIKEFDHRIIILFSLYLLDELIPLRSLKGKIEMESLGLKNRLISFQDKADSKVNIIRQLLFKHHEENKIAIWGAGSFTGNLLPRIKELSRVKCIVDSDSRKQYMELLHSEIPSVSHNYFYQQNIDILFIFSQFADEIVVQLRKKGLINRLKYVYRFFPKFEVINE